MYYNINTRSSMYIWPIAKSGLLHCFCSILRLLPMPLAADAAAVPFNVLVPRRSFELPQSIACTSYIQTKRFLLRDTCEIGRPLSFFILVDVRGCSGRGKNFES